MQPIVQPPSMSPISRQSQTFLPPLSYLHRSPMSDRSQEISTMRDSGHVSLVVKVSPTVNATCVPT